MLPKKALPSPLALAPRARNVNGIRLRRRNSISRTPNTRRTALLLSQEMITRRYLLNWKIES
jgi:hypothetical protein